MPNINAIRNQRLKSALPPDYVPLRIWIGVGASMLGAFMAVLDIQITNSSLQDIQAALGATLEEGSWIFTNAGMGAEMPISCRQKKTQTGRSRFS